jgi:outer membrane protein assembly factor BamD
VQGTVKDAARGSARDAVDEAVAGAAGASVWKSASRVPRARHHRPTALALAALAGVAILTSTGVGCRKDAPSFEDAAPADELYEQGLKALEGREFMSWTLPLVDYQKAIEIFQAIIDNYPYSDYAVLAELRIADAYFDDNRFDEALSYYRDFSDLHPQHPKVPYTILRSAICHYEQITSVNRDQTPSHEALKHLNRLLRSYPYSPEAGEGETIMYELRSRLSKNMIQIGDFYLKRREFQAAAERYREVLNRFPGLGLDAEALFKLGVCYENMRREGEALRLFHVVIENFRDSPAAREAADHIAAAH